MVIIYKETDVNETFVFVVLKTSSNLFSSLDETTWFRSNVPLNRHNILESIQPKTLSEYEIQHAEEQDRYRTANGAWPHLSEYGEQFVLKTKLERQAQTE